MAAGVSELATAHQRSLTAEISDEMVRLVRDYTGRGPTKARCYLHEDLVVCLLQDTLTKGERMLADKEGPDPVMSHRRAFQHAMRDEAKVKIEQLTGRRVSAFLSDNHLEPDVAVEVFLLEPRSEAPSQPDESA